MKSTEPEIFADYFLLHRIAVGGMAEVFLAQNRHHPEADLVVIKRLHKQMCGDPSFVAMFRDEHRLIKRLQHPNIIRVNEFGHDKDRYYIAMEQVWGESLATLSSQCNRQSLPFPFAAALYICAETAAALAYAHSLRDENNQAAPVIHRDVTLGNVMVAYDGRVKVLDFGIAKAEDREAQTRVGQIKGTLVYLAPEQVLGAEVGPATDIYQLGVLLYKLLVGREPFTGKKEMEVMEQIIRGDVVKPSSVIAGFPSIVEGLLQRAMAKKIKNRFQNMGEFERVLRAVMGQGFAPPQEKLRHIVSRITGNREMRQRAFIQKMREGIAAPQAEAQELLNWAKNKNEPKTLVVELGTRMLAVEGLRSDLDEADHDDDQDSGGETIISVRPDLSSADALGGATKPNIVMPVFVESTAPEQKSNADESAFMDVFREAELSENTVAPAEFRSVEVLSHVTQVSRGGIADLLQLLEDQEPPSASAQQDQVRVAADHDAPSPWDQLSLQMQATNPSLSLDSIVDEEDDDRETQIAVRVNDIENHRRQQDTQALRLELDEDINVESPGDDKVAEPDVFESTFDDLDFDIDVVEDE